MDVLRELDYPAPLNEYLAEPRIDNASIQSVIESTNLNFTFDDTNEKSFDDLCRRNDFRLIELLFKHSYYSNPNTSFTLTNSLNSFVDNDNQEIARFVFKFLHSPQACTDQKCENVYLFIYLMATIEASIIKEKFSIADCALEYAEQMCSRGCNQAKCHSFGYLFKNILAFSNDSNRQYDSFKQYLIKDKTITRSSREIETILRNKIDAYETQYQSYIKHLLDARQIANYFSNAVRRVLNNNQNMLHYLAANRSYMTFRALATTRADLLVQRDAENKSPLDLLVSHAQPAQAAVPRLIRGALSEELSLNLEHHMSTENFNRICQDQIQDSAPIEESDLAINPIELLPSNADLSKIESEWYSNNQNSNADSSLNMVSTHYNTESSTINKEPSPSNENSSPSNENSSPSNKNLSPSNKNLSPSNENLSPSNEELSHNKADSLTNCTADESRLNVSLIWKWGPTLAQLGYVINLAWFAYLLLDEYL